MKNIGGSDGGLLQYDIIFDGQKKITVFEAVIVKPNQMQCNHVVDTVVCPKKAPYGMTLSMCMVKNTFWQSQFLPMDFTILQREDSLAVCQDQSSTLISAT